VASNILHNKLILYEKNIRAVTRIRGFLGHEGLLIPFSPVFKKYDENLAIFYRFILS
jgi:hypothetical protein